MGPDRLYPNVFDFPSVCAATSTFFWKAKADLVVSLLVQHMTALARSMMVLGELLADVALQVAAGVVPIIARVLSVMVVARAPTRTSRQAPC